METNKINISTQYIQITKKCIPGTLVNMQLVIEKSNKAEIQWRPWQFLMTNYMYILQSTCNKGTARPVMCTLTSRSIPAGMLYTDSSELLNKAEQKVTKAPRHPSMTPCYKYRLHFDLIFHQNYLCKCKLLTLTGF